MRNLLTIAAAAAVSTAACAQAQPQPQFQANAPKLIIVISIDQLSSDLWDEYRPHFTGGLARLASGAVFRNGYQSHAATETCPGHSTILSGARPARTGIVGNVWVDSSASRTDKTIYCAEDERVPGSASTNYTVSAAHLRTPTLGDLLKQRSAQSLNVAVAGKDRSAVMMSGHTADQRWYPSGTTFVTDLKGAPAPRSVQAINLVTQRTLAAVREPLDPTPYCAAKAAPVPLEGGGKPVGAGRFGRVAGDEAAFRASPEFDGTLLALAAALIQELRLGRDSAPDILSIGLSGTDFVGHSYGTGGQEMCLQLLSLDRDLGDFLARLDQWGIDYAVALTADHGGLDVPERLRAKGVTDAARIDPQLTPVKIGDEVTRQTGIAGPIIYDVGTVGDMYLTPNLKGSDRVRALDAAIVAYRAHPQVYAAYTKEEVARTPIPSGDPAKWSVIQRIRASFDPGRSGDLHVVLKPNIVPVSDTTHYATTHGSPWDYDRRVPILFWRPGMPAANREEAIETVDIMPTLAAMIGLPLAPQSVDGKCLAGISGIACPGGASSPERENR